MPPGLSGAVFHFRLSRPKVPGPQTVYGDTSPFCVFQGFFYFSEAFVCMMLYIPTPTWCLELLLSPLLLSSSNIYIFILNIIVNGSCTYP